MRLDHEHEHVSSPTHAHGSFPHHEHDHVFYPNQTPASRLKPRAYLARARITNTAVFPTTSTVLSFILSLKQIQEHPGSYNTNIFIGLKREQMFVARYHELCKAFDRGFDVLVVIRILRDCVKA
jgi:hypothetical protein